MVVENDKVGTDANVEYDPQNDEIFLVEFCTRCRTGGVTGLWALLYCLCLDRADSHVEPRVQMLGAQELCHQLCQHHLCGPASEPHRLLPEAESEHQQHHRQVVADLSPSKLCKISHEHIADSDASTSWQPI